MQQNVAEDHQRFQTLVAQIPANQLRKLYLITCYDPGLLPDSPLPERKRHYVCKYCKSQVAGPQCSQCGGQAEVVGYYDEHVDILEMDLGRIIIEPNLTMPADEIHFFTRSNELVGKIINLEV